jgi:hypothetical protein
LVAGTAFTFVDFKWLVRRQFAARVLPETFGLNKRVAFPFLKELTKTVSNILPPMGGNVLPY